MTKRNYLEMLWISKGAIVWNIIAIYLPIFLLSLLVPLIRHTNFLLQIIVFFIILSIIIDRTKLLKKISIIKIIKIISLIALFRKARNETTAAQGEIKEYLSSYKIGGANSYEYGKSANGIICFILGLITLPGIVWLVLIIL